MVLHDVNEVMTVEATRILTERSQSQNVAGQLVGVRRLGQRLVVVQHGHDLDFHLLDGEKIF